MNFLAHCFLAQPNQHSLYGNLLGDFIAGADLKNIPNEVQLGLKNHQFVDKFTDSHPSLPPLKNLLSKERKRFSGIMSDVVFDYFLIKHWQSFTDQDINQFVLSVYMELSKAVPHMHVRMASAMRFMMENDGLLFNQDLAGVSVTLDRLSNRIRFKNHFAGSVNEIKQHYTQYENAFLSLFPDLISAVQGAAIEEGVITTIE